MDVTQIYKLVNDTTTEVLGEAAVKTEDLSDIVDIGEEITNAAKLDKYVGSLVDRIGKVVFVDRVYSGNAPSILIDSMEYGAIIEKISVDMPEAVENDTWKLTNGTSYPYDVFYQPQVSAKFFSSKSTFEIDISVTERQVKSAFLSAEAMTAFIASIYNAVDKSMTVKIDSLIMRTINHMTAETLADASSGSDSETTGTQTYNSFGSVNTLRAVNLLTGYNDLNGTSLTADKALADPEFIRYASLQIGLYQDRLSKISTLFNVGGAARFTPRDMLRCVMLSEFRAAADAYLQSDTYHEQYTALPGADTVPYWQGSGQDYSFNSTSSINITINGGDTVEASGILAVMFDRDACAVANLDRRVTTTYNPKAEFFSNYYKFDAGYYNDLNEQYVVFFIADADTTEDTAA